MRGISMILISMNIRLFVRQEATSQQVNKYALLSDLLFWSLVLIFLHCCNNSSGTSQRRIPFQKPMEGVISNNDLKAGSSTAGIIKHVEVITCYWSSDSKTCIGEEALVSDRFWLELIGFKDGWTRDNLQHHTEEGSVGSWRKVSRTFHQWKLFYLVWSFDIPRDQFRRNWTAFCLFWRLLWEIWKDAQDNQEAWRNLPSMMRAIDSFTQNKT
jgi:hypothetical protein